VAKRNIAAKIILTTFYGVAAAGLLPCIASAHFQRNQAQEVAQFQGLYDQLTKAFLARDVATVSKLISPSYSAGDYAKPIDKAKTLNELKHWDGKFKTTTRKVLHVVINGEKATVLMDSITTGDLKDKAGDHKYVIKGRSMDTWEHTPTGWLLKHARVVQKTVSKDGKSLRPHLGG